MIQFPNTELPLNVSEHTCQSYRDGDWVVFVCDECPTYERRINWRTGEMKVKDLDTMEIIHRGQYTPEIYSDAFRNLN